MRRSRVLQRLSIVCIAAACLAVAQTHRVIVRPPDTGAALVNPGMGWQFHHFDNNIDRYTVDLKPSDAVSEFPGVGSVYIRLAWNYVEPEEDRFDWTLVDSAMQRWISLGKRVALRFTSFESDPNQPFATPKWVMEAGAKGFFVRSEGSSTAQNWEPDYDDVLGRNVGEPGEIQMAGEAPT